MSTAAQEPAKERRKLRLAERREQALRLERQQASQEHAVLVAVEFTTKKSRLTSAAQQARAAATFTELAGTDGEVAVAPGADAEALESVDSLDFDEAVAEFRDLARSAGAVEKALLVQRRPKPDAATLVGGGKLEEIIGVVASTGASLVLFDHDLTPSQARNIEARLPCTVIDRTQLILDIFAKHARTREGMLQVELAQLEYQLPRLAGRGKSMSQLGGGIGTRGPGETKLETDKRRIRQRVDHLKQQLENVRRIRRQQRQRREAVPVPTVALVGYTNAGKSTLFNALTGAAVLESRQMFATLDPKLRQLTLPSHRRILLSDTVGFVRNLPHALISSFRATLEEVERAELLLHVQDAASPVREEQRAQVLKVLDELDVKQTPIIEVWNKMDLAGADAARPAEAVGVSALTGQGLGELLAAIDAKMTADPLVTEEFRIPQSQGRILAALERGATIESQRFVGNLVYVKASGPASLLERYRKYCVRDEAQAERAQAVSA
jgi:GTP-binding protein HflX